jgi:hypothetical protein
MTLLEAINYIRELPKNGILFVEPISGEFRSDSRTVALELSDSELELPTASVAALRAPGTEYFLEIYIIREFIESWQLENPGIPLFPQAVQRIIRYAVNDA